MEQENTSVPAGTVLQVYQVGYLLDDRCLRPAMVVVSRGGPKAGKSDGQASESSENRRPPWPEQQAGSGPATTLPAFGRLETLATKEAQSRSRNCFYRREGLEIDTRFAKTLPYRIHAIERL